VKLGARHGHLDYIVHLVAGAGKFDETLRRLTE
jgi:hypothetical protein